MLFRKDYAFLQVIVGIILIVIPIILMILSPTKNLAFSTSKTFHTIVGLVGGGAGIYLITNGYYKLTDRFKEYEPSDLIDIQESEREKEESD